MADTARFETAQKGITEDGFLTDSWYFAATSKELKSGSQFRRIILGEPVLLGRTAAGDVLALRDICPHRLVPLSAGKQVDTDGEATVECPYHGWRFGKDGVCKHMPSLTGKEPYDTSRFKVRAYPVHEANGCVFIYVAHDPREAAEPCVPPPDFGALPDKPKFVISEVFNAHMDDAVVGLMDPAHVPFVHNQWWWRPPSAGFRVKEKPFEPRERGWAIARHQPSSNSLAYKALFGGLVTTEILFQIPGYRWEIVENDKARLLTLTCLTPEAPKKTRITQITWWTGAPLLNLAIPVFKPAARMFLNQDGRMVDLQNEGMKYQSAMMWIDDIDVQAKWYRTLKRRWADWRSNGGQFENPIQPTVLSWRS
ncbi:MAG: aromatic ring-hydroxylating dioxygenase subunit alpha [Hyphomonadaceae bacterium]|nr:aromatic ring-hydroxylating dioxygenase subunit alpha [Hyphomonadaceae bacterium]